MTNSRCDLDSLVQELRQKGRVSIQQRCAMMRVLDMVQPIELNNIYTNVNVLERISRRRRLAVADIFKTCAVEEFERPGFGKIPSQRLPGLEAVKQYSTLMVFGKPGSGKTTFLKYIAIQCSLGTFQAHLLPIFITLKDFAEAEQQPSLLQYINAQFAACGVIDTTAIEYLLSQGKVLVLLDGLDEVLEVDWYRVLQEVRSFSAQFYANQLVITCRIAALEYTFEQFAEVEVADFDEEQITTFATKWFVDKDPVKGEKFIKRLKQNPPLLELATNPLLLTLLCLVFEESVGFPAHRSELYQEGLNILLKKWDAKRNIEREQVYKKLSVQHKENLLSQIARITFERGEYFFTQEAVEQYITDYICNFPNVNNNLKTLQLDSEAVLKSLEIQHGLLVERARGIYSFSHLTFQEYFTAKEIVTSHNPKALEAALQQLASRLNEKRWREVFLLTTSMLRNADYLLQLMKQQSDNLIAQDKRLQKFLIWLSQKSCVVAVRAFYLDLSLGIDLKLNPALSLALKLDPTLGLSLKLDLELDLELDFALSLTLALDYTLAHTLDSSLARALSLSLDLELQRVLQQLKGKLPDSDQGEAVFKTWWKANGKSWVEQLRAVQAKYRNIGHNWQFSTQQRQALQQYHDANKLIVDCLNCCYMSSAVRERIEETLLLPFTKDMACAKLM